MGSAEWYILSLVGLGAAWYVLDLLVFRKRAGRIERPELFTAYLRSMEQLLGGELDAALSKPDGALARKVRHTWNDLVELQGIQGTKSDAHANRVLATADRLATDVGVFP